MGTVLDMIRRAQRKALARKFALGLLRPFSGMNVSVRLGEIAHNILSRWPIRPQTAKPIANFCYLTMCDRAHWLMLRESLFSLYRSWNSLPEITVVSDGSWTANDFAEVFAWWPMPITVLMREEICLAAMSAGFRELADYARESIWGLELAALTTQAKQHPVLYADTAHRVLVGDDGLHLLAVGGSPDLDGLVGAAGDDTVFAHDGEKDTVYCGPGNDTTHVDTIDVTFGCETVVP